MDCSMSQNQSPSQIFSVIQYLKHRKFLVLLSVMLFLNALRMVTVEDISDRYIVDVLGASLIFAATLSLCVEKRSRFIALILGIPSIVLMLLKNLLVGHLEYLIQMASSAISLVFLAFIIFMILRTLMTKPEVTRDSIAGAFCGYVMIGIMFAEAYCLLEILIPHSFQVSDASSRDLADPFERWLMLEYFSFTTLTTLGFGDVIPISVAARGLAIWEVIGGQFYLAVLVAGLVNLRAAGNNAPVD
jgi:hypothetical protein